MTTPTELLRAALLRPIHPGDGKPFPIDLPMFRAADNMPPGMAKQFAADAGLPSPDIAKLTAEAQIAHLAENNYTIVPTAELDALRQTTADKTGHQQPRVHCHCGRFLYSADINTDRPVINGPRFIRAIAAIPAECKDHRP